MNDIAKIAKQNHSGYLFGGSCNILHGYIHPLFHII